MKVERIDARDVLDANAKTACAFAARTVGHFRRAGPNAWDDYLFESIAGGEVLDVSAGVPVQVEPEGAVFRMRCHGEVLRLGVAAGAGRRRRRRCSRVAHPLSRHLRSAVGRGRWHRRRRSHRRETLRRTQALLGVTPSGELQALQEAQRLRRRDRPAAGRRA